MTIDFILNFLLTFVVFYIWLEWNSLKVKLLEKINKKPDKYFLSDELPYFVDYDVTGLSPYCYAEYRTEYNSDACLWFEKATKLLARYKNIQLLKHLCVEKYPADKPAFVRIAWKDDREVDSNGNKIDWSRIS